MKNRFRRWPAAALSSAMLYCASAPAQPAEDAGRCLETAAPPFAFWYGHWDVYTGDTLDGRNFIEPVLEGCAVLEHWEDASGYKGLSVFYFDPHGGQWKQVWLTDHARRPGGTKEKTMIHADAESVRFQGTIRVAADRFVLDRTTLRKLDGDRVNQVIEYSKDGGTTWVKTFDAIYQRPQTPSAGK